MRDQQKLDELLAEGMSVYPTAMRGLGDIPRPKFLSTSQSSIAGLGQARRPASITGDPTRVARVVKLNARQTAWGSGRSRRPPSRAERARNEQRFVQMMKKTHPRLYALAKQRAGEPPAGLGALGQKTTTTADTAGTWFSRFTDTVTSLAPTYLQYQSQKELLQIQLERARQGLAPLETSQYAPAVQIGLDPAQTRAAIAAAGTRAGEFLTQPMVLAAGAGLLLLVLMRK